MGSMLEQLELQIADRFLANAFFGDIEVHVDPQKNIVAEVTRKIAQCAALVAPFVSGGGCALPDDEGPRLDPIKISVGCFVNPAFAASSSWSGKTCRDIAEECASMRGMHHWKPDCLSTVLIPDAANCIEPIPDKVLNVWNVNFYAHSALTRVLAQVATPVWDGNNLTSATPGAAVFYTTNGNNPGTSSALALPNLDFTAGTTVKARAWLAGWLTSELLQFVS